MLAAIRRIPGLKQKQFFLPRDIKNHLVPGLSDPTVIAAAVRAAEGRVAVSMYAEASCFIRQPVPDDKESSKGKAGQRRVVEKEMEVRLFAYRPPNSPDVIEIPVFTSAHLQLA